MFYAVGYALAASPHRPISDQKDPSNVSCLEEERHKLTETRYL